MQLVKSNKYQLLTLALPLVLTLWSWKRAWVKGETLNHFGSSLPKRYYLPMNVSVDVYVCLDPFVIVCICKKDLLKVAVALLNLVLHTLKRKLKIEFEEICEIFFNCHAPFLICKTTYIAIATPYSNLYKFWDHSLSLSLSDIASSTLSFFSSSISCVIELINWLQPTVLGFLMSLNISKTLSHFVILVYLTNHFLTDVIGDNKIFANFYTVDAALKDRVGWILKYFLNWKSFRYLLCVSVRNTGY